MCPVFLRHIGTFRYYDPGLGTVKTALKDFVMGQETNVLTYTNSVVLFLTILDYVSTDVSVTLEFGESTYRKFLINNWSHTYSRCLITLMSSLRLGELASVCVLDLTCVRWTKRREESCR